MSDVALAMRQVRYTNKAFWRNPASAFFTFAFPLMFLVIFTALFGNSTVDVLGREVQTSTFYVLGHRHVRDHHRHATPTWPSP